MPAPVESGAPSRGGRPRRILRGALEWIAVAAVTLVVCELALRLVLGIQPLTTEALVWQHHPRWGWSHRPNSEDLFVKPGCRQEIRINSRGLREREIGHEKPPGTFRILALSLTPVRPGGCAADRGAASSPPPAAPRAPRGCRGSIARCARAGGTW